MKIHTEKIEVKVKEEEVKVAEISEEEFIELIAKTNGKLLASTVKAIEKSGLIDTDDAIDIATKLTDYVATLTHELVDIIYHDDEEKEED